MSTVSPPFDTNQEALLHRIFVGGRCLFTDKMSLNGGNISGLAAMQNPDLADKIAYALIICEAPAAPDQARAIRFTEVPSDQYEAVGASSLEMLLDELGLPLGHMGVYEVKGKENLANFRCKVISGTAEIRIQYFG